MGGFEIVENGKHVSCCSPPLTNIKANGGMETQSQSQPQAHHHPTTKTDKLYSLSEQIEHVERNLNNFVDAWHARKRAQTRGNDLSDDQGRWRHFGGVKVILIGHSVGAYIAMEILRRHREGIKQKGASADTGGAGIGATMDIVGGILLFPTVVDIAQSSSGRKLTVRFCSLSTQFCAESLLFPFPLPQPLKYSRSWGLRQLTPHASRYDMFSDYPIFALVPSLLRMLYELPSNDYSKFAETSLRTLPGVPYKSTRQIPDIYAAGILVT